MEVCLEVVDESLDDVQERIVRGVYDSSVYEGGRRGSGDHVRLGFERVECEWGRLGRVECEP